jgi:N utilization substance protein A
VIIEALEQAVLTASRKKYGHQGEIEVHYNEEAGEVELFQFKQVVEEVTNEASEISLEDAKELDSEVELGDSLGVKLDTDFGRIGAQTAKQVILQRVREAERDNVYNEFKDRKGDLVSGTVQRLERGNLYVNIGRAEAVLLGKEQIPGETHQVGERIQALITEVRDTASAVKIILSRSHPELIRRLFEREVPEVGERTIELKALAREPGHRTKIAVSSIDSKVDAVGACVGVRGSRIKNIVDELGGEKIDIVRWNESSQILIGNALKPAEVAEVSLCFELGRATVVVNEDQLSLAIGKRGQNVRLAARLTGWDIDILTPAEFQAGVQRLEQTLKSVEGFAPELVDKVIALGLIDVRDIEEVGTGPMIEELGLPEDIAQRVIDRCTEDAKVWAVEQQARKEAEAKAKAAAQAESRRALDALLGVGSEPAAATAEPEEAPAAMPGMMEAAEGGAPEVTVHAEQGTGTADELSPEEQAIGGMGEAQQPAGKEIEQEESDTAALAEGRTEPPPGNQDETV